MPHVGQRLSVNNRKLCVPVQIVLQSLNIREQLICSLTATLVRVIFFDAHFVNWFGGNLLIQAEGTYCPEVSSNMIPMIWNYASGQK